MANHHGVEGIVRVGANAVAEVKQFSVTETAEFAEDTTLNDTSKTYNSQAIKSWSGSLTCQWDEADAGQTALVAGASVTLNLYPEGTATGDTYLTGTALITEVTTTVSTGAITERSFNFQGTGALSETTV